MLAPKSPAELANPELRKADGNQSNQRYCSLKASLFRLVSANHILLTNVSYHCLNSLTLLPFGQHPSLPGH